MISDIRKLEAGAVLESDLCIVGGGAVGVAMGHELSGAGFEVCVLEGGGLRLERESQTLADGETDGLPYFPLTESRYRLLGGSTFRWGARSAPLTEFDFQDRAWVPYSGWPLTRADLQPYYDRGSRLIGLHGDFEYDGKVWHLFDTSPPPFDADCLQYSAFQFGKTLLLGEHLKDSLKRSDNVHLYLYANAINIQSNDMANHVDYIDVKSLNGKCYRAKAKVFVLACGGIENPRLLLLSNAVNPRGLCNEHDLVGRFFMEHPTVPAGTVVAKDLQKLHDFFSPGLIDGRLVEVGLALSPKLQAAARCLNGIATTRVVTTRDATQALREILWNLQHRRVPLQASWYHDNKWLLPRLGAVLRDPVSIATNIVRHLAGKPKRWNIDSVYLEIRTEQAPNPESRVTLSEAKDELGQARPRLHWDLTEGDKRTMQTAALAFDRELRRLNLGKIRLEDWLGSDELTWSTEMVGGHHHMGTTRMSELPTTGIVDRDCKAHAIDNLYIGGSSVFPTCGYVNPTLTILALALRLADHLRARLA